MADQLNALPKPIVSYYPDTGTLVLENGKPLGVADGFVSGITPFFDRTDEHQVVGLFFDGATEALLKPLIDEALEEHGLSPLEWGPPGKAAEVNGSQSSGPYMREPQAKVWYSPEDGYLQVENGRPLGEEAVVADGVLVFHDTEDRGRLTGLRIGPDAKVILKPFVDVALAKYGGDPGKAKDPAKPAS